MKNTPEKNDSQSLAVASEPSVGHLMEQVIQGGITESSVAVMERLMAMKERNDARIAEQDFARAFHALQSETLTVQALDQVPDKHGGVRYTFASYERIMREVRPLLLKHGFSVSFDSEFKDNRLVMRCTLTHTGGHHQTTTQYMRVSAPYGANDSQADGATATMAKRYALCAALNITIERDTDGNDANNEGQPVSHEQAQTLRELVKETGSDEKRFLAYAQAATYEEIGSERYDELFRSLQQRLTRR